MRQGIALGRPGYLMLASLFLMLAPTWGIAGQARADVIPQLAGTTVFTADGPGTAVVRLVRSATLIVTNQAQSPDVTVTAPGRLGGFVLTALDRPDPRNPLTLVAMQVGGCAEPACRAIAPMFAAQYINANGLPRQALDDQRRQVTLAAGRYAVRSVTDGAPARMTLRLTGLSGRAAVRVGGRNRMVLDTYTSTDGPAGINPARSAGGTHRIDADLGLLFRVILSEYEPHVRSLTGFCLYLDKQPPAGRFVAGCPDAEYGFLVNAGQPTLHFYGYLYGSDVTLRAGDWTQGFYSSGLGGPSTLKAVALWLDLG